MLTYGLISIGVLILVILIRTLRFKTSDIDQTIEKTKVFIDPKRSAQVLSEGIQIKTISTVDPSAMDCEAFEAYHKKLEELFPLVHKHMVKEAVNTHSLLYKWSGEDQAVKPVLMTAHMDVVPVEASTEDQWTYPPFSGAIEEGFVWGRGSLDTKVTMLSALQGAELLLEKGFVPKRDIYFAFGHDEEVRGTGGATEIAKVLKERGISFDFLMDEGGTVVENVIKGIDKPLALIGIAEKGYANVKVTVNGQGGHASMPPKSTALGRIAKVITNLEENQAKLKMSKPVEGFLLTIGPEMGGINKVIIANFWLFKPIFLKVFSATKSGNALLRTTTAATMASASNMANVLPESASATFNFRIAPGESVASLLDHIKEVNKGIEIDVEPLYTEAPSIISSTETEGFHLIKGITHLLYEEALIAPYIVLAATDARKYEAVCKDIYRFAPYKVDNADLGKMHSSNENISIDNVKNCVEFYVTLFENV